MENQRKDTNKALRSGERQVRENLEGIEYWHKWRYQQACEYIGNGDEVLDVGCGCGYGTAIMADEAHSVTGVDDSAEAVDYATKYWKKPNSRYINMNAMELNQSDPYDTIVAFEVIEHIKDDKQFVEFIKKMAKQYIVVSVPHITVPLSRSHWHWRHYTEEDITNLFVDENWKEVRMETPMFGKGKAVYAVYERISG